MPDTHDYPLAQVLGTGNLTHHARPAALPGRIETRCGQEGERTDRDGSFWCPDCLALERAEANTHDERGGNAAMEVARYADQYVAYADGDSDTAPGRPPIEAMRRVREQLAAATARAEAAEAELGRMNRRTDFLDDALKGLRQQAIEAVKERNAETTRAEKAEAERRIATELSNRRKVERNQARALMYSIIGAIECAYALNTYVELEPGETAPTIESLWAEVREIRGLTADAAQDGLSATETRSETTQGVATESASVGGHTTHPGIRLLGHAYITGWVDAIAAYRAPGWTERETGWHQFRNALENDTAGPAARAEQEAGR